MITVKTDQKTYVGAFGHAGFGPAGSDIVCAGISALWFALFASLEEVGFEPVDENGVIKIRAPDQRSDAFFQFFLTGARLIAEEYPDNVMIVQA